VTEYGAFVDLGGIDGLLHLTDLSWGRVEASFRRGKAEQELDVIILKFDKEKQRVSLGLKQLMADPWVGAAEKYPRPEGEGKSSGFVDYAYSWSWNRGSKAGARFEMSWNKKIQHPSKVVKLVKK